MAVYKRFLDKLREEQMKYLDALKKPKDKTEFGFGQISGQLQGLSRAEQLFTEILEDEKNDKNN